MRALNLGHQAQGNLIQKPERSANQSSPYSTMVKTSKVGMGPEDVQGKCTEVVRDMQRQATKPYKHPKTLNPKPYTKNSSPSTHPNTEIPNLLLKPASPEPSTLYEGSGLCQGSASGNPQVPVRPLFPGRPEHSLGARSTGSGLGFRVSGLGVSG